VRQVLRDPRHTSCLLAVVLLATLVLRASAAQQAPAPAATPVQPVPYSHKKHVALGLDCRGCHINPDGGKLMTYPPNAMCMACHRTVAADRPSIQKLTALADTGAPIPWARVYRLPDYVFWEHAPHLKAGVTCAECHGAVAERDVITVETNILTMAGCLACHNKRQVFTDCIHCHEPRQ
jgi:hypothetical protein